MANLGCCDAYSPASKPLYSSNTFMEQNPGVSGNYSLNIYQGNKSSITKKPDFLNYSLKRSDVKAKDKMDPLKLNYSGLPV